jgi:hypothetical protein
MQGVQEHSQIFFTNLLTLQTQGFQQVLALMQSGHNQNMEAIRASTVKSDPNELIKLLLSGIKMGRDMDEPEQPFWQEILQGGVQLLTGAKAAVSAPVAPMGMPALLTGKGNGKSKTPKTKEAKQLLRLYKALRTRGIDIEDVTNQLEAGTMTRHKAQSESPPLEEPEDISDHDGDEPEPDADFEDGDDADDVESDDGEPEELEGTGEPDTAAHS